MAYCNKITKLIDVEVIADLSRMVRYYNCNTDNEKWAKELERAVKEFELFLRDHRSQDLISLEVRRVWKECCTYCGNEWESDHEGDRQYCCHCGSEYKPEGV